MAKVAKVAKMAKTTKTNKSINKDLMFKKIMPSADITNTSKQEQIYENDNNENKSNVNQTQTKQKNINSFINHATSLPQKNESYIINLTEKAVTDNLDSVLERFKCCKCDKCKKDMIAIALNSIEPHYVVTSSDKPLPDIYSSQSKAEIATSIVRAIIKVKANPNH